MFNDPHKGKERDFAEFQPVQYIRIPFELEKTPVKARIYTTAHGFYRLSLNGSRADEREMTPDLMSYEKVLMYQTYDVTERLREGKNVIGVELADGWWSGRNRNVR
ncbi:MAG: alpha-L-rhamnosidase N-terminal domain-containing protein [Mediterraneibacter faecis]